MTEQRYHLTPDELDLWLEGRLPAARTSHLETCDECRTAAEETREVVERLAGLPQVAPGARFPDQVLARLAATRVTGAHLSDEELDDWVGGVLSAERQTHMRGCGECRALADQERLLVLRLEQLPLFDPSPRFAARVLAEVALPVTSVATAWRAWRRHTFANPTAVGVAAGLAVLLGGSIAASVAWTAGNQELITGAAHWLWGQAQQSFWLASGTASQLLADQPWYSGLRTALTPGRLVALAAGVTAFYAAGIVALRRLMSLPAEQVVRAAP